MTFSSPLEQCRRVFVLSYPTVPKWDHLQLWLLEADLSSESPKKKERTWEVIKHSSLLMTTHRVCIKEKSNNRRAQILWCLKGTCHLLVAAELPWLCARCSSSRSVFRVFQLSNILRYPWLQETHCFCCAKCMKKNRCQSSSKRRGEEWNTTASLEPATLTVQGNGLALKRISN